MLPALTACVEPDRWQRLQDHFAAVLGIPLRTVDAAHRLLVTASWPSGLPADRLVEALRIGEELDALIPPAAPPRDTVSHATALGVTYAMVPVRAAGERPLAYVVAGPLIVGPREQEMVFRRRIAAQGGDASTLWGFLLTLRVYTYAGLRSVLVLLEDVTSALVQYASQAQALSSMVSVPGRADQVLVRYYTDRILHALLEAAITTTRAEGGSVLTLDPQREVLEIKAAQGLHGTVVGGTRLAPGEGIAGLVLQEREIRVLDDATTDARYRSRMTRPELVSSLVAPLIPETGRRPIGVLCLRASQPGRRFTSEHVEAVNKLLTLADTALSGLRTTLAPSAS